MHVKVKSVDFAVATTEVVFRFPMKVFVQAASASATRTEGTSPQVNEESKVMPQSRALSLVKRSATDSGEFQ